MDICRHLSRRSNPTDVADELLQYKSEWLTLLQAEVLGNRGSSPP